METLNRVRFVTANFYSLQGLRYIPVLVLALIVTLEGRLNLYPPGRLEYRLLLLAMAYAAAEIISRYYRRTFGAIHSERRASDRITLLALAAAVLIDVAVRAPVSVFGLVVAAFWAYHWRQSQGYRSYYAALAVISALTAFLPLVVRPVAEAHLWLMMVLVVTSMGGMILDHLLLVRLLSRPSEG